LLLLLAGALAGCGSSDSAVARVDGTTITRNDLDAAVDHFRQEADAEGRPFPSDGTAAFRTVERQALALLVYRAELVRSAQRLGVPVTEAEVTSRMSVSGEESEGSTVFARNTVEAQVAYEHIYSKVTSNTAAAKKGAAMKRWLEEMADDYEVSYEAGFGTAS
jgi:hypothetical protein